MSRPSTRHRTLSALGIVLGLALTMSSGPAPAQERRPLPSPIITDRNLRVQLETVDHLLMLENLSRASAILEDLAQRGATRALLLPRLVSLARLQGEHARVVELCREALVLRPDDPVMLRELGAALIGLDDLAGAEEALARFVEVHPNPSGGAMSVVLL